MQFASLYIGDLHPDVGEAMLYEAFESAGRVASCRVCRDTVTRRSLGYGYVNYYSVPDAERALETLNYMKIKGKPCRLMWSQKDPKARMNVNANVFVKKLDLSVDSKALHAHFAPYGKIMSCKVSTTNDGKSRGYGFVNFDTEEAAKEAIEKANGTKLGDSTIFVGPFMKKEELVAEEFTNLYVKHLPPAWDEAKLSAVFGEFGEVKSVWLSGTDDGKRFALVNYATSDGAKQAVEALHKKDLTSEGVEPEPAKAAAATAEAPAGEAATGSSAPAGEAAEAAEGEKRERSGSLAEEDLPAHLLYVQRAQTRAERKAALEAERRKRREAGGRGGKGEGRSGVRLCIKNLGEGVTEQGLRELFEPFGKVISAQVRTHEDGKCRGIGFVVLASTEQAAEATGALHLKVVDGKPLSVGIAERRPREARGDGEGDGAKGKGGKGKGEAGKGKGKGAKGKGKGDLPPLPVLPPNMLMPGMPPGAGMRPPYPYPNSLASAQTNVLPPSPYAGYPAPRLPYPMPMPGYPGYPGMPPPMPYGRPPMPMPMPPYGMPPPVPPQASQPLTRETLARMPAQMQKQRLGTELHSQISRSKPEHAGKLTGMMLELDNDEILGLLSSDQRLQQKISQAMRILEGPSKHKK